MNLSIQDELQLFSEELYRHLTPSLLEELAKELGVVKRKRKFSGNELATRGTDSQTEKNHAKDFRVIFDLI
ncbi:transposase for insertion sequence element IS231C [Bacillus cereus VD133]|uniref:Transposase for insertion sequence element IS231C n=1 Tax=Bacillus cereus VD133 TaxID=1053233 RepID=A0A9W5PJA6_BACCE|nr:transposase for insertion sequence element IS231C [Bacillus cereus VD133]